MVHQYSYIPVGTRTFFHPCRVSVALVCIPVPCRSPFQTDIAEFTAHCTCYWCCWQENALRCFTTGSYPTKLYYQCIRFFFLHRVRKRSATLL